MPYEPVARLGRGGMAVVDLAVGPDGTQVALKRLTLHGSAREMARARQRIRREAEVLAQLRHPHVVELLEVLDDDGDLVLVMPYLPGGTLADRVAAHGPAPAAEVARLASALLGALAEAHRAGIVHRDVKPANVLYDAGGQPLLADFGVASARDLTDGLTAAGTVVGTPPFMAPEQARGEEVGRAADVFALGATLLWAATGEGPWGRGEPAVQLQRAATGKPAAVPRHLPADLRALLGRMLDPRPERRPTAAALAGGHDGTDALPLPRSPRRRPHRRPAVRAAGAAAVVALVAVGTALALWGGAGSPGADAAADDAAVATSPPTTEPCVDLPFQPCDQDEPAPGTDGVRCLEGFEDYDGDPRTGCEAEADGLEDGTPLIDRIEGTIVPAGDVDRFTAEVEDRWQLLCDGEVTFRLTAPPGMALRLEVYDEGGVDLLGEAVSAGGLPAEVVLPEPSCFRDDTATLEVVVRPVGSDRVGEPYVLEREGSW